MIKGNDFRFNRRIILPYSGEVEGVIKSSLHGSVERLGVGQCLVVKAGS